MENPGNDYLIYFFIFIAANIILFLFYRYFEASEREQAVQNRLDAASSYINNSNTGTQKGLFTQKSKSESLLERKINSILSKRSDEEQPLQIMLYRCGISTDVSKIIFILFLFWLLFLLFLMYLVKLDPVKSVIFSFVGVSFIVFNVFSSMQNKRQRIFREHLPQTVDIVLRGIRSGSSIEKTFVVVARETPSPLKEEFEQIINELEFGLPYDRVLMNSADRVNLSEYYFFVTALIIQRQSGGSLSDVLDNIIYVLGRSTEMQAKVKVLSAEGRMSGLVLAGLPIFVGLFMYKFNPDHLQFYYVDPLGQKLFYAIIFLFFLGYISIKKMLQIRI